MNELRAALAADPSEVAIASPFIKRGAVADLLAGAEVGSLRVVTRFNLDHFSEGVSDTAALRMLMARGARIRGVKRLHAKMYLFGDARSIITSANLTEAGLLKNHELGVVAAGEPASACRDYFETLWNAAGEDLEKGRLDEWEERVAAAQLASGPAQRPALGDEGAEVGPVSEPEIPAWFAEPRRGFVKFFGEAHNRAPRHYHVLEELRRGGAHWACTYPVGKRPRAPRDGDAMFMSRLVHGPDDTMIYGRAVAIRYEEGRDDASPEDLALRPWKKDWPHYIRVHHGEFLDGAVGEGVSLREMMDALGAHAFGPTEENLENERGNIDPRMSIRQAAAIRLSPVGLSWLNEQLELAFEERGKLQPAALASLDWPTLDPAA